MSEPVKEITDVKEAALWALLKKFEEIDQDASSRSSFGGSIVFSQMNHMDKPIFDNEITLIRAALGIKVEEKPMEERSHTPVLAETTVRFDLGDL